ncbi:Hypothetical protein D9617_2g059220 [Elsinoe fawcettii]|nr:Hypothetical protein D9617_2g059220 [Elsinoe fawcettii]
MKYFFTAASIAVLATTVAAQDIPATAGPAAAQYLNGQGSLLDVAMSNVNGKSNPEDQCAPCILDTLNSQQDPTLDSVVAECGEQPTSRGFVQDKRDLVDDDGAPMIDRRNVGCPSQICGPPPAAATLGISKKPGSRKRSPEEGTPAPPPVTPPSNATETDDANAAQTGAKPGGKTSGGFERNTCKNPNEAATKISEAWDSSVPETPELRGKFDKVFGDIVKVQKGEAEAGTPPELAKEG